MRNGAGKVFGATATRSRPGPLANMASTMAGPTPIRRAKRLAVKAPTMAPLLPIPRIDPDLSRRQAEVAHHVDDVGREGDVAEQVRRRRGGGDAAQVPVAQYVAKPGGDLPAQPAPWPAVLVDVPVGGRLLAADEDHEEGRRRRSSPRRRRSRTGPSRCRPGRRRGPGPRSARRSATSPACEFPPPAGRARPVTAGRTDRRRRTRPSGSR